MVVVWQEFTSLLCNSSVRHFDGKFFKMSFDSYKKFTKIIKGSYEASWELVYDIMPPVVQKLQGKHYMFSPYVNEYSFTKVLYDYCVPNKNSETGFNAIEMLFVLLNLIYLLHSTLMKLWFYLIPQSLSFSMSSSHLESSLQLSNALQRISFPVTRDNLDIRMFLHLYTYVSEHCFNDVYDL